MRRRCRPTWRLSAALLACAAACKHEPRAADAGVELVAETPATPGPRVRLRGFVGSGISGAQLARETRAAQRLLSRYGVRLTAAAPPGRVAAGALLGGSSAEIERIAAAAGPDSEKLAARAVAAPLAAFIRARAAPPRGEVVVLLVERIAAPHSPIRSQLPELAGLTLSPLLSASDPGGELEAALALPPHDPVVLLSAVELERLGPARRRATLAHELGHALGLPHVADAKNLMAPRRAAGRDPVLEESQLAALRRGAETLAAGP